MLGKLLLLGGSGVVALGVVGDLAARSYVEDKIAEKAEAAVGGGAHATADIDSFPFVLRLLTSGRAGDVSLHVEDVATDAVELARVDLDLEGVRLDRAELLTDRKARVTDIERGTITMGIHIDTVSKALGGLPISFRGGTVHARIAGKDVASGITVVPAGQIGIHLDGGPSASIRIPRTDLISCDADTLTFDEDELIVTCTVHEVPPALLRAAQQRLR